MALVRESFETDEVIFNQGDPGTHCYQVVTGRVEIRIRGRGSLVGSQETVAILGPGEVFGEMSIVDEAPRSATAVAIEPTVCAVAPADEVLDLIASNPDEALFFIKTLVKRLRRVNKKLAAQGQTPG